MMRHGAREIWRRLMPITTCASMRLRVEIRLIKRKTRVGYGADAGLAIDGSQTALTGATRRRSQSGGFGKGFGLVYFLP